MTPDAERRLALAVEERHQRRGVAGAGDRSHGCSATTEVEEYVELIAERAARFGGYVEATARTASKRSALAECPASIVDGLAQLEALSWAIATFGGAARRAIGHAGKLGDADTADFFNEVSRAADELLWMVEAHLQGQS